MCKNDPDGDLLARQVGKRLPQFLCGDAGVSAFIDDMGNLFQHIELAQLGVATAILEPHVADQAAVAYFKHDFTLRASHELLLGLGQGELAALGLRKSGILPLDLHFTQDGSVERGVRCLAPRRGPVAPGRHHLDQFLAGH